MATPVAALQFRGLDPDLPSIAALAAAEVDGLLRHEPSQLQNLGRLAQLLTASFDQAAPGGGQRHLLDPVSANVFASSWRDARATSLSSYDELAKASLELAEQMKQASDKAGDAHLGLLKRFCLALSRYALASAESLDTVSNGPDYKR
jgi:hypothetical protein